MCRKTLLILMLLATLATMAMAAKKGFTLVIDAGHGGHDAGALGATSKEKNINLNVALAFGRYVEANCPDVNVVYTRKTDVFVPLHQRADIANKNKADLFVSVHTNALPGGKQARGLETYTLGMHRAADNFDVAKRENSVILVEKDYKQHYEGFDPNSSESYIMFEFMQDKNMAQSVELAKLVQSRTCAAAGRPNKGVKQAGFLVLRETSMPSCLIELGFITTPSEEQYLNSQAGIDALGKGIYQAFVEYKGKYDKRITVPYQAATKQTVNIPSVVPQDEQTQASVSKASKRRQEVKRMKTRSVLEELTEARREAAGETEVAEEQPADSRETADRNEPDTAAKKRTLEERTPQRRPADTQRETKQESGQVALQKSRKGVGQVTKQEQDGDEPVFKVQITTSDRRLRPGSQQFKGVDGVDCYQEGNLYKYTCGASTDYNEIYRLRKSLLDKFPEAFIIAFKNGQRTDVVAALRQFKARRGRR